MIGARDFPTLRSVHHHASGFHGSPVDPTMRRVGIAWRSAHSAPSFINARMNVGVTPRMLTRWDSTIDQTRSGAGTSGAPSYMNAVAPLISAPATSHGPIIQPISVSHEIVSSGFTSNT